MSDSLFSPSWYRVSPLKPRLRGHVRIHRHLYRGELWYVLQDQMTGRHYRFTPAAYQLIGMMNGKLTIQELWELNAERLGDDAFSQGEVIHLLSQLHSADILLCDVSPDTAEIFQREEKIQKASRLQNFRSPLSLRFPLVDPDRFLNRTIPFVRPLFHPLGFLAWLAMVLAAIITAGLYWEPLTADIVDRLFSAENLLILVLVFPFVKALHELGHAYAVKAWGGEVHEIGIMFLVFMPVPYVDASAASAFPEKNHRMMVGAAGIMTELFLAALALFTWTWLEPGFARALAYNTLVMAGVSSILFNGNPLLRYDGYYVLADWLEIPNLASLGLRYLGYLFNRFILGAKHLDPPPVTRGERPWFVIYSVAAFFYRILLYAAIILLVAEKFFFIGILLAAWSSLSLIFIPLWKGMVFILSSPVLQERRFQAIAVVLAILAVFSGMVSLVPLPLRTMAEGVMWPPEEALVRAGTSGFFSRILVKPNERVRSGEALIECRDPLLEANLRYFSHRLAEMEARHQVAVARDPVGVRIIEKEITFLQKSYQRAKEQMTELTILSPTDGTFILPDAADLQERFLKQGDLLAYVVDVKQPIIRVVISQGNVDLVRQRTQGVEIRFPGRLDKAYSGTIVREVPGAAENLPSTVLGSAGGGKVLIDPRDSQGLKTFEKLFQFDIEVERSAEDLFLGSRAYVRFDHGQESASLQFYRFLRQQLLRRFNV